jgi:hypothetical protein
MAKNDVMPETLAPADAEGEELQLQVRKLDALETTMPRPLAM